MSFQKTFMALSDHTRRKILDLLKEGPLSAGEIGEHFDLTGASISHHLSVLREAGLVDTERRGTFIYYELNLTVMQEITSWLASLYGGNDDETV